MNRPKDPAFQKEYDFYTEQLRLNSGSPQIIRGLAIGLRKFISGWEQDAAQQRCPDVYRSTLADGALPSANPDQSWQRIRRQIREDIALMYELLKHYEPRSVR